MVAVSNLSAQNLAPNPDFEFHSWCPSSWALPGDPLPCEPWSSGTWGTTDYFNSCATPGIASVPDNFAGWQYALSGVGYTGVILKGINNGDYREYLMGQLTQPLLAGQWYYVSFYVSLGEEECGIQQIGAYFSATIPPYTWGQAPPLTQYTPQVETNGAFLNDTANWMLIEGCFQADGGEAYVIIGNFHTNADTPLDPTCTSTSGLSYYYIEDVYIGETQPGALDVELGGPVSDCYSVEIDPGLSGVSFSWSTGSTDPSITVTSSGVYHLTISNGCEAGVDSIEVLITDAPPVDLDPDALIACPGQSISFSLDPDLGDYEWSDGSTSPDYTINTTGIYSVTLDDGCDITSDGIDFTILDPPAPFTLGADTLLCTGNFLEFYFDPDLGDFMWQNGSQSNSIFISTEGYYALTISNMCGEASAELEVMVIDPVFVSLGNEVDTLCDGEPLEISLDPWLGEYVWQDGSTDPDYQITNSGLYSVTLSHQCGVSADTVMVTSFDTPVFELGDALFPCPGDTIVLTANDMTGNYLWQDDSTNDTLMVTSSGTYTLTIENVCGFASDEIVIQYEDTLISPDLGPDFDLCPGEVAVLSTGSSGTDYIWQDLSTADSLLINVAGTYHVTVSNHCFSFADTVIVTIENEPPAIQLPNQLTLCQGSVVTLDPGVSGVTYIWNDGTQNPTLAITNPGEYSLTVTNACGMDIDTVEVLDGGPLPSVSLGMDEALCPGETIVLNPLFSDVDMWLWPDGSGSSTYTVADSGIIDVIVSNACGVSYDTIEVGLLEATPDLDLGVDTSMCPGESITLSILFSNVDISWNDGSTDPSLIVDVPGQYYASVSNTCGITSDTLEIGGHPDIPMLELGPDLPLCPGEELTIAPGIPGVDYQWQDGSWDTFFLAVQAQLIQLTISNLCGTSTDTLNIYTSTIEPDVDLGTDILACEGEMVTILSNISGVDFLWQDGYTGPSFLRVVIPVSFLSR